MKIQEEVENGGGEGWVLKWRERNEASLYSPRFPRFYWRGQSGVLSCMTDVDMCTAWDVHAQEQSIVGEEFSLPPFDPPHPRPISLAKREEHRVSFHIRFQVSSVEVRAQEIQKIGQSDRLPSIVLQMNDQLESHKPFFTAEADPWGERRENFKNHPWFLPIDCNFILINFSAV